MKDKIFPLLNILSLTLLDEIKMQAIVMALSSSPKNIDQEKASHLHSLIIPADLTAHKKLCPTLFDAMKILAHLMWTKPIQGELDVYNNLLADLSQIIIQYKNEEIAQPIFLTCLHQYYQQLADFTSLPNYCFFKQSSKILPLIQFFRGKYPLITNDIIPTDDLLFNLNK